MPQDVADSNADTQMASATEMSAARTPRSASSDSLIGVTLSERYRVTRQIGQGGMGAVFEAQHTVIGKRVAVKVLLDKHAEKDQVVARLKQEARLASSIGHENIIDITDFGTTIDNRTFVVMEYLEGESLAACIAREGQLTEERAIHIASQVASALTAAHAKGVVHRDIKPENVFLQQRDGRDFVKVVDFGISKSMRPDQEDVRLTQTGMVLGTPLYMSPEQARGDEELDHRVDVYALGVILYEAVTGEVPFRGKNYLNILTQVIADEPKKPTELRPGLDRNLESVILKAMSKDREQRYASMSELAADLLALDDPNTKTTGARITAARWRRRQERRSALGYLAWTTGVLGVGALAVLVGSRLLTSDGKEKVAAAVVVPPAAIDAGPAVVRVSADARPAFVAAKIQLVSLPPGATVYEGSKLICSATPCIFDPPKVGAQTQLTAELEGYLAGTITVTPELDDGETLTFNLREAPATDKKGPKNGRKPGRDTAQSDPNEPVRPGGTGDGTGDTLGNPFD